MGVYRVWVYQGYTGGTPFFTFALLDKDFRSDHALLPQRMDWTGWSTQGTASMVTGLLRSTLSLMPHQWESALLLPLPFRLVAVTELGSSQDFWCR